MNRGEVLKKGEKLTSGNSKFILEFQTDGDLVLSVNGIVLWRSDTSLRGDNLIFEENGNLNIYDSDNQIVFTTNTSGKYLKLEDDGNLVVNNDNNRTIWSTKTSHCIY